VEQEHSKRPDAQQTDVLALQSFHQGAILTSYAQVEFVLADIVFRWRKMAWMRASCRTPSMLGSRLLGT
jgi:hypothetical protein